MKQGSRGGTNYAYPNSIAWGVGGQAADLESDLAIDSAYELTNHSSLDWETKTRSQDWIYLNQGDGSRDLTRTTIVRF